MKYDKALVGKKVLLSIGWVGYDGEFRMGRQKSIRTITKVTRKGFRIEGSPLTFDFDGFSKQKQQQMSDNSYCYCLLLSESEVEKLKAKWEERKRRKTVKASLQKDLKEIQSLINKI